MKLLDSLRREQVAIEGVALAFVTFADAATPTERLAADGARFLEFFRLFAGHYHHEREETVERVGK